MLIKVDIIKMSNNITIKEAAKILGVSQVTLRRWDKNGKLKPARHRFNNYRIYNRKGIEELYKQLYKII